MSITPLPTPPSRNDPTNFATRADAFLGALPTFATEANALAVEANADAAAAAQSAIDATNNGAAQVALAAAQAGIATTQAGISTTQAGIATTQAGIATTKAAEASASADAAASSAANISLGEKLNLGAKASDPTVDNQGDPLLGGAIYYNTVAEETRQWTGTFWKAAATAVNGTASRQTFTATAGQTTFSIVYDIGFVDVYLNGLKLQASVDFTATNGTSIVLASPATAGDVVDIVAYGAFSLANTYTQAQTDTMLAAKASLTGTETLSNKTLDDPILTLDGSEGTAGQVPMSQGAGLPPVWGEISGGGEFAFIADGAITAGKAVILKSNGKAAQSVIASESVGSPVNLSGNNATAVSTCYDPVNDKFVVFYIDTSDGNNGKAVVGSVSGSTVAFGTPVVFYNAALYTGSINGIDSCYDEDTGQIIVAYSPSSDTFGRLRTCTVSGTTVSFGAELNTSLLTYALGVCYDTSVNRVLFAHRDGSTQKAAVISVSGTSLTLGATGTAYDSSVDGYTSSVVHCQGHSTAGYNVICFNTGGRAYIIQARIDPSTFALSFGTATAAAISGADGYAYGTKTLAWSLAYQRLIVLCGDGPSLGYSLSVQCFSINGTGFTNVVRADIGGSGSYSAPYQNFPSVSCSPSGESVCVAFPAAGSSNYGSLRFSSSFSAPSISFGSTLQYQTSDVGWTSVAYDASGKTLVGYSITSGLGKAVVGTAPIPDSRTSFIGFAQNTVSNGQTVTVTTPLGVNENQSGLTPNTNYFLSSTDGSTLTTTVNGPRVGKALSATKLLVLGSNVYQV